MLVGFRVYRGAFFPKGGTATLGDRRVGRGKKSFGASAPKNQHSNHSPKNCRQRIYCEGEEAALTVSLSMKVSSKGAGSVHTAPVTLTSWCVCPDVRFCIAFCIAHEGQPEFVARGRRERHARVRAAPSVLVAQRSTHKTHTMVLCHYR